MSAELLALIIARAEERGAEWAIRAKAQVVYSLAGDEAYKALAREVCEEARKRDARSR